MPNALGEIWNLFLEESTIDDLKNDLMAKGDIGVQFPFFLQIRLYRSSFEFPSLFAIILILECSFLLPLSHDSFICQKIIWWHGKYTFNLLGRHKMVRIILPQALIHLNVERRPVQVHPERNRISYHMFHSDWYCMDHIEQYFFWLSDGITKHVTFISVPLYPRNMKIWFWGAHYAKEMYHRQIPMIKPLSLISV